VLLPLEGDLKPTDQRHNDEQRQQEGKQQQQHWLTW